MNDILKLKLRQAVATLIKGILAGFCIGVGAYLYLIIGNYNKVLGAIFFSIGLILILNFGYFLFTGKICYLGNHLRRTINLPYYLQLIIGLVGNYLGATITGLVFGLLNNEIGLEILPIDALIDAKMANSWYIVLLLAIACNIMIYFAVEAFAKIENSLGKYIILIVCIAGFILMGFEHCVANMFYLAFGMVFSWESIAFLLIVIIGNIIGGLLIPTIIMLVKKLEKK